MILADTDIKRRLDTGDLVIEPLPFNNIEPASVDLRLGRSFARPLNARRIIDPTEGDEVEYEEFEAEQVVVEPGDCLLATTLERIELPPDLAAHAEGRSTLGRMFVSVHQTAGYCDPGFKGQITLEITNASPNAFRLHESQRVAQLIVTQLTSEAERPYGHKKSQYQDQEGATPSGLRLD